MDGCCLVDPICGCAHGRNSVGFRDGESRVPSLRFRTLSHFALLCVKLRLDIELCVIYTAFKPSWILKAFRAGFSLVWRKWTMKRCGGMGATWGNVSWSRGLHAYQACIIANSCQTARKMASDLSFGMTDMHTKGERGRIKEKSRRSDSFEFRWRDVRDSNSRPPT